jgi:hypothetical protein
MTYVSLQDLDGLFSFPLGIVCHDAGAANIIKGILEDSFDDSNVVEVFARGPSREIFRGGSFALSNDEPLFDFLSRQRSLLIGTGWVSDLEQNARKIASTLSIPSISVLDHWVNYRDRFISHGNFLCSEAVLVFDEYGVRECERVFSEDEVQIVMTENPYVSGLVSKINTKECEGKSHLYLCEPMRTDWGRGTPGEFQALEYFLQHKSKLGLGEDQQIGLRLHPTEPRDKYTHFLSNTPELYLLRDTYLEEDIGRSSAVIGVSSAALIPAFLSGRRTISCLPPWAGKRVLPHSEIEYIRDSF